MEVLSPCDGPARVTASGKILRYIPNVWVPEATRMVNNWKRILWQFCGQIMENSLIMTSGLNEAG
jgi:hypothetical protein